MKALSLQLKNFRNYHEQSLEFSPCSNFICGNNAQGKTNLLEALYYCAATKSFRQSKNKNLVNFSAQRFEIFLLYNAEGRDQSLRIRGGEGLREIYHNEVKKSRANQIIGQFLCVLFAPEHLDLVKEGPAQRRRFIDAALCMLKPSYFQAFINYQRILNQKGMALRQMESKKFDYDTVDIYNQRLSAEGALLIKSRYEYYSLLKEKARQFHLEISDAKEELDIFYKPNENIENGTAGEIEEELKKILQKKIHQEISAGICLAGPHRDDSEILINGQSARLFGSQGQQRSCVLSLKLAESEMIKDQTGEYPVILLDDILSELDQGRQNYIIRQIENKQVILTCCEKIHPFLQSGVKYFRVEDGKASEEKQEEEKIEPSLK